MRLDTDESGAARREINLSHFLRKYRPLINYCGQAHPVRQQHAPGGAIRGRKKRTSFPRISVCLASNLFLLLIYNGCALGVTGTLRAVVSKGWYE